MLEDEELARIDPDGLLVESGPIDLADWRDYERMKERERVALLADELGIDGRPLEEMLADPARAKPVLERARRARGVRNPAALAIARFRNRLGSKALPAPRLPEPEPEFVEGAPSVSDLEHLWSLEPSALTDALAELYAAAIARAGGFDAIRDSFAERLVWDHEYDRRRPLVDEPPARG